MKGQDPFFSLANGLIPTGDVARQAVDALRGYAYQVTAAALAWLDLSANSRIFLEVAEDYAVVANDAISAVQIKDTRASGTVTLNTESVRDAISNFVSLTTLNTGVDVHLRYFTTSDIGLEKTLQDRPCGLSGLTYWRNVAKGAEMKPLRAILESNRFPEAVREFVMYRDDDELRRDLFRKIHWDCGKPDLTTLSKEFQDRLIVVGRDTFNIPAPDTLRISSLLFHHVLLKSIGSTVTDRVLTRADLIHTIDHAARVSIPIAALDAFTQTSLGLLAKVLGDASTSMPVATGLPTWISIGSGLPAARHEVRRPEIEKAIENRLRTFGACFVYGASGVGKSSVSRAVAERVGEDYFLVDFRSTTSEETRNRLDVLLSRLGGMRAQVVILEDLNQFNAPGLATLAGRVFESLSRRDIAVIVTSYAAPTAKVLSAVGQSPGGAIDCRYFSEEESASLVGLHGGDPKLWGRLAHVSGAFGHPQLVHAFVAGTSARGWPREEAQTAIESGLSNGDIAAERDAARRSLISVLPESARNLLYRLSMTTGSFSRAAALRIATTPPPITHAGEALDALIGPWIETTGRDNYRVSPLASTSGKEMLPPDEQKVIHREIASQLVSGESVNANDVDKIIMHAILGKNERVLASLAVKLLTSGSHLTSFLADNSVLLVAFEYGKPIYPENIYVSLMLRLAQFKVLAAGNDKGRIQSCVSALLSESDLLESGKNHSMFQLMSLGTILGTMGIGNHIENWVQLILQFHTLANDSKFSKKLVANLEAKPEMSGSVVAVLFAIGSSGLTSVTRLEHVFEQLSHLRPEQRVSFLELIERGSPDYSVLVNSPWVTERHGGLDGLDAAARYHRMAILTSSWGIRALTIQCWIARAVMLDEYADDFDGALNVLDGAMAEYGDDVLISRARAKVYWRAQDHERSLSILRDIADVVGRDNCIERAFALREAAISAANCDDWSQAEEWFRESKIAASKADTTDMKAMAVGLGADAAVAAFNVGRLDECLRGLASAVVESGHIQPDASLQCSHCHHVLRHTILWVQSRLEGRQIVLGGEPITMQPGICSNPDPVKQIAERPLGSIDFAWYMLAESELMSRANVGILDGLYQRLNGGVIPVLDISLRTKRLAIDIEDINPAGFCRHLLGHVEGMAYLSNHAKDIRENSDVLNPARENLPALPPSDLALTFANFTNDAVFAFAISCACRQVPDAFLALAALLDANYGQEKISGAIFARAGGGASRPSPASFEDALVDASMAFRKGAHAEPRDYCVAGLRFLQQAQRSSFRQTLVSIVAAWQRNAWTRIVVSETFRLSQPQQTVPAIKASLSLDLDNEKFLCSLLLACAIATGVRLPADIRGGLESLASSAG